MPVRRLPVRPNLEQLQRQAKELLRAVRAGDANAIADMREHHPDSIDPSAAKLADAQLVLARTYGASSWPRLVHAVRLADAIWRDDADEVRALVTQEIRRQRPRGRRGAHPTRNSRVGTPCPRVTPAQCIRPRRCGAAHADDQKIVH